MSELSAEREQAAREWRYSQPATASSSTEHGYGWWGDAEVAAFAAHVTQEGRARALEEAVRQSEIPVELKPELDSPSLRVLAAAIQKSVANRIRTLQSPDWRSKP